MGKKKQQPLDFRYYNMPQRNSVLIFSGPTWKREYGVEAPDQLHFHNIIEIGICRDGYGKMMYEEGRECEFEPGMISIIPRNVPHNTLSRPGTLGYWEYIFVDEEYYLDTKYGQDPLFIEKIKDRINSRTLLVKAQEHAALADAINGIIREHDNSAPYSRELIHSYIDSLLVVVARENQGYDVAAAETRLEAGHRIVDVITYIDKHYMEEMTVGDLALYCQMSETNFRRRFTAYMNMSPVDYVNVIRIRKACGFLRDTDYSMDVIAEKVGYTTPSTFNRNFRHFVGTSPYQWKKEHFGSSSEQALRLKISAHRGWE